MTMRLHQRRSAGYQARHFLWQVDTGNSKVAVLTLDRPDKKNPLTFDSYAELLDFTRMTGDLVKAMRAYRAFAAKEKPVFEGN
jgi:hypothetical protein